MRRISAQETGVRQYLQPGVQNVIVPAPTSGWNARDPIALMEPKFANVMDNWVPQQGYVTPRPGFSAWAQNIANSTTSPVESLMTYRPAGSERLFAACNGLIVDVTLQGAFTTAQTGLSNNRWQYVNFTPALGSNYLWIVNGQDAPRYWNGSVWTQANITGGPAQTSFNQIAVWKRRIWLVQSNSTVAWYLATDAIDGAVAGSVDIGALLTKGGHLVAIGTFGSSGTAPDDYLVLLSSRGEAVIYKGTDPTSASSFQLVLVLGMPPPLGNRPFMDVGADLAVITLQGVVPVSQMLPADIAATRAISITSNIQNTMLASAQMYQNNFGWECLHYPAQGMYILNVPTQTNTQSFQYVQNAITGAWCRFTGWNANTFALFNDSLYFGDNHGNVNQAWVGGADLVTPITSDLQCAFNYFGDPGRIKKVTMVQPLLQTSGALTPTIGIDVDFGSTSPASTVQTLTPSGSVYGTGTYGTATYGGGTITQSLWFSTEAQGKALAIRMKVNLLPSSPNNAATSVFDTGTFDNMVFDDFGTGTNVLQVMGFNALINFGGAI
jgi:hypothetical protein